MYHIEVCHTAWRQTYQNYYNECINNDTMQLRPHQLDAVNAMSDNTKGQVIVPTGGGKTMCMIEDAQYRFDMNGVSKTIVVVAPRILLANQLSSEFLEQNLDGNYNVGVEVIHVHS